MGNKCDVSHREVSTAEGQDMASRYNLQYIETSAKTNICINETFDTLTDIILQRRIQAAQKAAQEQQSANNIKVRKPKKIKKSKKSKCSYL